MNPVGMYGMPQKGRERALRGRCAQCAPHALAGRLKSIVAPGALALALLAAACDDSAQQRPEDAEGRPASVAHAPADPEADPAAARAWEHVRFLVSLGGRPSGSEAYARQLLYLRRNLEEAGWSCLCRTWSETNPLTGKPVTMTNLYARFGRNASFDAPLPGLLSCHIDTKTGIPGFVGANDGASGAAVILETARALAAEPETARCVELVFFDGEESFAAHMTAADGLYGSTYDASRRGDALPRWMVNLDMVGRRGMKISVPADDTSQEMYAHYERAIGALGLSRATWQVALGSIYDDHQPFAQRGVHTLNLIDHFSGGNWWHTAEDNLSLIAAESLGESVRMTLQLLRQLAADSLLSRLPGADID